MKPILALFTICLLVPLAALHAAAPRPVRVLVWDEQQSEQKRAYGEKFLGETIAAHLAAKPGFVVKGVSLASPTQGLDEATLNDTDVVIWWSHQKNHLVADENVERLVTRVREGKLGFIPLHSAHWSKPFVRLMQERAKDDARAQIPAAERATAKFEYSNQNPYGKVPKRDAPLTPLLRQEDGVWNLALPGCIFPAYRGDGAPSHVTTLLPSHPIAAGLPLKWDVKQTEMYDEPFHVPKPDAVVFEERWDKGEHFRSGCVWQVGQGRVFYFRPGHETYPVFQQAEPLRVLENAARWLAQDKATATSYGAWRNSGSLYILTSPEGANLPATASVEGFPLLVRLHRDWFDFPQAKANGEDIRFSTSTGAPLAYQIEEWDAAKGAASIWVRVPQIKGNERQELRVHWGKTDAASESSGSAVFNESNGYLSVWHMNGPVKDEVGTLESKDVGTTATTGMIGEARHLAGKQGIFGGDKIPNYPVGASPHSSEMWLRAEKSNGRAMAWGNEHGQGKVVMHFQSPPHVKMECYFSGADVSTAGRLPMNEWIHVVHTYQQGDSRIYVNGELSNTSKTPNSPLAIKTPARLWIGGWYHNYDFIGDIDEVRVSKVKRSADWVKLQYENQKANQTLVGPLVKPDSTFAVSPAQAIVLEGKSATFTAQAGGAQKVYWSLVRDGRETIVAVDRFAFQFDAGRVTGDDFATLRFKAVSANEVRTQDIGITVKEDIAEPVFTLKAPRTWDGRKTIEVVPQISNLKAMQAKGAGELKTEWSAGPFAVIKEVAPGRLILTRAQNSGKLVVTATISNGGKPVTQSVTIKVTEPKRDPWIARTPAKDEKPEEGQFYAREDKNEGTLYYNGTLEQAADSLFLKLYADDKLIKTESAKPGKDLSYRFAVKLKPGLIKYKVEFGAKVGGQETLLNSVGNIVCGDAYLIDGQSNALATDTGEKSPAETNEWVRSYGRPPSNQKAAPGNLWCKPVWKAQKGEKAELGWWGMELAKRLVESQKMPIFIINAAVGGTRIDQHQRNATNTTDLNTIYGRMLWRVQQAKLTHGIRGILWHQGENDQGADGPTGGFGWETYHPFFIEMSAAWKQDFPNVQHYYVYQIWPNSCSMGGREGSGDMLREKQRTLPELFSNMSILSTLGVRPPGGCHFPLVGWAEFARLIQPVIERDHYGKVPAAFVTAPNLRRAAYAAGAKDTITLEFDQPVVWTDALAGQFYLDGEKDKVASGSVTGNALTLKLKEASTATKITYLKEIAWSQDKLLNGANGLAALTFCNVPLLLSDPTR